MTGISWEVEDLISLPDYAKWSKISPTTMNRWAKSPNFPQPIIYRYRLYSFETLYLWVKQNHFGYHPDKALRPR